MLDEIREAFGALTGDMEKFAGIFIFGVIVFGVIIALSYVPNAGAQALGKSVTFACPTTNSYILPVLTHALSANGSAIIIQCAISQGNALLILLWYLQVQGIMFLGAIVGIMILIATGHFTG